jgi:hypothetical protein
MKTGTVVRMVSCLPALLLLAACATGNPTTGGGNRSGGSAGPATTARPAPGSAAPPAPTPGCAAGARRITIEAAQPPPPVCVRVGATLIVDAPASPVQAWQPFVSSDAGRLSCATRLAPDGAATGTCHAVRPGQATVTTTTAPFSGDPHGPAQQLWQLTVTVRP